MKYLERMTDRGILALPPERPFDVVGLGGNAVDHLITIPQFPRPDTKVKFLDYRLQAGGRTTTPLVTLSRLGFRCRYLGGVGDDEEGRAALRDLRSEKIDTAGVRVRPGGLTQRAFILIEPESGRRTIVWGRSEGMPLRPEEIDADLIRAGRMLYTDGQDPRTAASAARIARAAAMPVLADLEDIRPGLDELLPLLDVLIAPVGFPPLVTGHPAGEESLRRLEERTGGALVVLTLGDRGCLTRVDGRVERFPAYRVEVRDTTGAGDLFHAAFAAACLRGITLAEACDFSNAVAAMGCRGVGGRGALPGGFEEVDRFRSTTPHL